MSHSPYSEIILKMQGIIDRQSREIKSLKSELAADAYNVEDSIYKLGEDTARGNADVIRLEREATKLKYQIKRLASELRTEKRKATEKENELDKINAKNKRACSVKKEFHQVREQALERDNYKCCGCGTTERLHVHHILERCNGGTNDSGNLITLCAACHAEKHKGTPVYNIMVKGL